MPTRIDRPVASLDIRFEFQTGVWEQLFDLHVELIQQDILRSLADGRFVAYLSCPISSRGGSISVTNVEIAEATARRLTTDWGGRLWVLNPGQYQLESKQGTGLIQRHARWLKLTTGTQVDLDKLEKPLGGDYMRMWTRVLAEDGDSNLGERFSTFYFIGPNDYHHFFTQGGATNLFAGVEEYFARKYATDADFNAFYSPPFKDEKGNPVPSEKEKQEWESRRREFIRFYTLKAGAHFSKGAHDEWNIWVELNKKRVEKFGIGRQIPGYFEGVQVSPSAAELPVVPGYAAPNEPSVPTFLPVPEPATEATSHELAVSALVNLSAPTFFGAGGGGGGAAGFATGDELTLPGGTLYESFFWGISRHEMIAGAAHRLLLTNARQEVERILGDLGAGDLSEIAGWADRVKYRGPQSGDDQETVDFLSEERNRTNDRWHYVDIPLGASSYEAAPEFTREDDVVHMLREAIRVLLGSSDRFSEANALRLVTHLAGDVHQPLHVGCSYIDATGQTARLVFDPAEILANGYGDDQGGNAIWLPVGIRGTSMHSYWDSRLGGTINLFSTEPTDGSAAGFAAAVDTAEVQRFRQSFISKLVRMFPSGKATSFASPAAFNATPADELPARWANDTLKVAPSAYESLTITGQHTDDQGKVKYDVSFDEGRPAYDQRCKPLVRQQMQLAAQNLGALLNKIWP